MHLQVLPPKDSHLRGFLHWPVQNQQTGITECCTFCPFDVKLEKGHLLHIFQPPVPWEQVKVLMYYVKPYKRGGNNGITMNYTRKTFHK